MDAPDTGQQEQIACIPPLQVGQLVGQGGLPSPLLQSLRQKDHRVGKAQQQGGACLGAAVQGRLFPAARLLPGLLQRGQILLPRRGAPPQQSPAAQSIARSHPQEKEDGHPPICSIDHPRPVDGVRGHPLHSDGAEVVVVPDAHLPALPVCIVDMMTVPHWFSVHVGICPSCSPCSGLHDPLVIQMIGVVPVIGAMSHHLGDIQLNGSGKEGPQYGAENGIGHQADSHHGPGPIPPVR